MAPDGRSAWQKASSCRLGRGSADETAGGTNRSTGAVSAALNIYQTCAAVKIHPQQSFGVGRVGFPECQQRIVISKTTRCVTKIEERKKPNKYV